MPVSPRDFELYSRMTGTPMPSDAMSRMQMAPEVFEFTKNFARKPNLLEKTGNLVKNIGKSAVMAIGAPMVAESMAEQARMQEQLRNQADKAESEAATTSDPVQASEELQIEKEKTKRKSIDIEGRKDLMRMANSGVQQTNLNPDAMDNYQALLNPTTGDAYGQKYNANQTSSNMIERKISQGSQIADDTQNVAEVISESQDSRPSGFADTAQVESQMRSGMEGSELSKDQLAKFLSQKGLDQALLGAIGERISAEPRIGDSSPLLDHPDIVGGEDDINLPGGMNTGSRTNLEDHYREMRRMDAMERNKAVIDEAANLYKNLSPSERQIMLGTKNIDSPNEMQGRITAAEESSNKLMDVVKAMGGEPSTEQQIMADQAKSRIQQKTAYKQRMAGMSTPLVEQYYPSDVARTDIQVGGMLDRKTNLPKSVGISYTPMNGETGVTYNIMNDPTKPLDVSRTHFTATPEAVQQLLSQTGELGKASYGQQYNKGKRRMAGLGSMDESRIDDDNFLII